MQSLVSYWGKLPICIAVPSHAWSLKEMDVEEMNNEAASDLSIYQYQTTRQSKRVGGAGTEGSPMEGGRNRLG